jgi:predicted dehydrogenase
MNVGIVGCGLIGRKRAQAMPEETIILSCFDASIESTNKFAKDFNCVGHRNLSQLLQDPRIDFVVIATQHNSLANLAFQAIEKGKHIFIEKPGAISSKELHEIAKAAKVNNLKLHVGFNHQYHPAIFKMFKFIDNGAIGELMYLRARYGHGGRLGYEKEWRADKEISGGGELIDQGSHLIDISLRVFRNLYIDYAYTPTFFWDMPVEDNAFIALKDDKGCIAFLHASCTEWKNMFSLEVYGNTGKIEVSGLGRSYGIETLTHYQMLPEMGPPLAKSWQFTGPDDSWRLELQDFISDIKNNTHYSDNIASSIRVLELIEQIYERTGR